MYHRAQYPTSGLTPKAQSVSPKTQGEMLIAALFDYVDENITPIPGLTCYWTPSATSNGLQLRVEIQDGNGPLIQLLANSQYASEFQDAASRKISDLLRYLCNTSNIVTRSGKTNVKGPRKGRTTYLFALPSQEKQACLQCLQSQQVAPNTTDSSPEILDNRNTPTPKTWFPEGAIASGSPFYVERLGCDDRCREAIHHPGALLRIKSPTLMGKTSLLFHLLDHASEANYRTMYLNLAAADRDTLTNLETFSYWFCSQVAAHLGVEQAFEKEWSKKLFGSATKCSRCFSHLFLSKTTPPLVLAIDEIDRLFPYQDWADDFFKLLRSWHDKSKSEPGSIWQQLRLAIAYSTEDYVPRNVLVSPFNVGVYIPLEEISEAQVQAIAQQHNVSWSMDQVRQLMSMVGGHPHLVQLAVYHAGTQAQTLASILNHAATTSGIYQDHLFSLLVALEELPALQAAFKTVVHSEDWVHLYPTESKQLSRLGLITQHDNQVRPRNALYRQYFNHHLR